MAILEDTVPGAVEVNGWWLAAIAAAIVIAFVLWQAIQAAKAKRTREEVVEQGPATLTEAEFWEIVHEVKDAAKDDVLQRPSELNSRLRASEPVEVAAFHERYQKFMELSDTPPLRAVADAFVKNCTDSDFVAFRDWLISEGDERFQAVLKDPASLPAPVGKQVVTLEAFGYAAPRVYKSKRGKPISKALEDQIEAAGGQLKS